jgi:hypothetical protein
VTNTSQAPLTIGSVTTTGTHAAQFSRTIPAAPTGCATGAANALQPGRSCIINVFFNPAAPAGAKNAQLNVNVAAPAANQSVPLTGTGTLP